MTMPPKLDLLRVAADLVDILAEHANPAFELSRVEGDGGDRVVHEVFAVKNRWDDIEDVGFGRGDFEQAAARTAQHERRAGLLHWPRIIIGPLD